MPPPIFAPSINHAAQPAFPPMVNQAPLVPTYGPNGEIIASGEYVPAPGAINIPPPNHDVNIPTTTPLPPPPPPPTVFRH